MSRSHIVKLDFVIGWGDYVHKQLTAQAETNQDLPNNSQVRNNAAADIASNRDTWSRPFEFVLSTLGYAVGLGNVWRFPFLCFRNGGGAFFIPFVTMIIFIGIPLFYLELYVGQYSGMGPLQAFCAISPFFSGLGYCTLVVISYVMIYYMVIIAWNLYYLFVAIVFSLRWSSCENEFNSMCNGPCDVKCRINNKGISTDLTYYKKKCTAIQDICLENGMKPYNGTHCLDGDIAVYWYKNVKRILASEEYFNEGVLGRGNATWENWGNIQWHIVLCLFFSWLVTFLCLIKGVKSAGKVVYFTTLFPYVMLTVLLVRGVTLDGAGNGLIFYLSPKWDTLWSVRVWGDAASQVFYSFGVGCGSLITLASYNNFYNNCRFHAISVSGVNFLTSVYAGLAIFSVLGFEAKSMGVSVREVAAGGPSLAFVAYPAALILLPWPRLWSILFFFMLFILGLGSQFAGIAVTTAILDRWPSFKKDYWRIKVTAMTCTVCFILGLPMCFSGGVYLVTLLDWHTASWAILIIGLAECTAVAWSYGINRALRDLASMRMKHNEVLRIYWKFIWSVFCPFVCVAVLLLVLIEWRPPCYHGYQFPLGADLLGWAIGTSTLVLLPVGVFWALKRGYRGKALFTPTSAWKPALKVPHVSVSQTIKQSNK